MNSLIRYFDLYANLRGRTKAQVGGGKGGSIFLQYIVFVIGIAVQPYLAKYQTGGTIDYNISAFLTRFGFSFLIGMAIFPQAYRNIVDQPEVGFLKLCLIFSTGITWQTLLGAGQKAALGG